MINKTSMVLENIKKIWAHQNKKLKVPPSVYLSNSLPMDDKDVCCGFLDTFDNGVTFFTLAAAASL